MVLGWSKTRAEGPPRLVSLRSIRERKGTTMKLNTYLNYGGNCEQAFRFYEKHLGGKISVMMTHEQQPGASDVPPERFQPMRSVYLSLAVDSNEEAARIHALLSDGGQVFMPMQETFFAFRFSMLRDKFGTSWMVIYQRQAPPRA